MQVASASVSKDAIDTTEMLFAGFSFKKHVNIYCTIF